MLSKYFCVVFNKFSVVKFCFTEGGSSICKCSGNVNVKVFVRERMTLWWIEGVGGKKTTKVSRSHLTTFDNIECLKWNYVDVSRSSKTQWNSLKNFLSVIRWWKIKLKYFPLNSLLFFYGTWNLHKPKTDF